MSLPSEKLQQLALDIANRNNARGNQEAVDIFLRMAGATRADLDQPKQKGQRKQARRTTQKKAQ